VCEASYGSGNFIGSLVSNLISLAGQVISILVAIMCVQHGNTKNCAEKLCETRAELANSSVERTFFLQRTKEEEKTGVSNGMKPRTQILDKTQKKE
jgi:cellobiose-specific phosphotransferase system component IIA